MSKRPNQQGQSHSAPTSSPAAEGAAAKKPYRAPKILSREPLEAMANVCDPAAMLKAEGQFTCTAGSRS